ncbi:hypothetical protein [Methylotenera sp. 1P/1]|uniref:hypothetical protein n=1 Tax=Methylotenera sp. 1P/1 TaxID=1131551 RepID=UPI0003A5A092|nr:hypothetical protein [Methylotenera sp. 1P/1]
MRLPSYLMRDSLVGVARGVYVVAGVLMCIVMGYLLVYIASLNADIAQANTQADLERQCAHALEAWVHRQVAPGELTQPEALDAVKDKACRTKLVL